MTETLPNASILAPAQAAEQASSRARAVTQVAAVLLLALCLATMTGWLLRLPGLLQLLPGQVGMVIGTALCFALAGAALLIPVQWSVLRRRALPALGGLIVLAATAMLAQHALHVDLGVDLRWLHAWLGDPNPTPGRMAPNTALAFVLGGMALVLMPRARSRAALRTIETLAFSVVFIGLVSGAGYTLKLEFLYGWYQYSRMSLPTAAGMVVLGIGLLGAWHQLAAAAPLMLLQAHNRIVWIGGAISFTIALVAGLGGFALMQQRTETTLQDGLLRSLQSRSDFFAAAIDDASRTAQLIATRPALYRHLRRLNAEPGDANELALLAVAAQSFLTSGVSAIAFNDQHGRELVRAGSFVQHPELSVPLALPYPTQLVWRGGLVFEAHVPMRTASEHLGTLVVQRPLATLSRMLQDTRGLGDTGETGVCAPAPGQPRTMVCFPLRLSPDVVRLPYEIGGRRLPMSYALEGQSGVIAALDYRRQHVSAAYGPIGQLGLGMVLKIDAAELYRPISQLLPWALLLLLGLIAAGMWVLRLLVTPLVRRVVESEEKYRAVAETANAAIVTFDIRGRIVYWNRAAGSVFGYTEQQILGEPMTRLIQQDDRDAHEQGWQRLLRTEQPGLLGRTVELHGLHQDGRKFPLEMSLSRWLGVGGGEVFYTGIIRDVSQRKQGEEAVRHLADIVASSSDAIISKHLDGTITSWNAAAERLHGYSAAEIVGQSGRVLLPPDRLAEEPDFLARLQRDERIERHETVRLRKDGTPVEVALTVSSLHDASGRICGTSTIARDITEHKRLEAQIRAMALTDELTGLHNRRGFTALAEQQLKLARRSHTPLCIAFVDMDGMKAINDRYGHAVGDDALKDTAALLRASFRDADVLARIGGDEFVVLAVGADEKTMQRLQQRLMAAVAATNQQTQHPYALSLSLGIVACDVESSTTLDEMIEQADQRMYLAKGEKRRADRRDLP